VLVTCIDFVHGARDFDCSVDGSFSISLPAPDLVSGLALRWSGVEGQFIDATGQIVVFDPSVSEEGPGALLVRKENLERFLAENKLRLIWIVLGEKLLVGGHREPNQLGWLEIDGAYMLTSNGIVGKTKAEHRFSSRRRHATPRLNRG
jgi:hypothetical protein